MLAQHTPEAVNTSQGGEPSSPCTIAPCAGISWSGVEVPQASSVTSSPPTLAFCCSRLTASAVSWALVCVALPLAGSMA